MTREKAPTDAIRKTAETIMVGLCKRFPVFGKPLETEIRMAEKVIRPILEPLLSSPLPPSQQKPVAWRNVSSDPLPKDELIITWHGDAWPPYMDLMNSEGAAKKFGEYAVTKWMTRPQSPEEIPAPSSPAPSTTEAATTTSAWLIERGQTAGHSPTIWWCGSDRRASFGEDEMKNWTEDANAARKFATKNKAEELAKKLFGPGLYSITDHVFIGSPTPPSAPQSELARKIAKPLVKKFSRARDTAEQDERLEREIVNIVAPILARSAPQPLPVAPIHKIMHGPDWDEANVKLITAIDEHFDLRGTMGIFFLAIASELGCINSSKSPVKAIQNLKFTVESQAARIGDAKDIIQELMDVQNGCPLPSYEKQWNAINARSREFVDTHTSTEGSKQP